MGDAAALIREHLWAGKVPGSPFPTDKNPWTMGRELTIWRRLVLAGWPPEDLNGAIPQIRKLLPHHDGEPLRLTTIYNHAGYATPLLEQAIGLYHKARSTDKASKKLPPTVRDILREMVG